MIRFIWLLRGKSTSHCPKYSYLGCYEEYPTSNHTLSSLHANGTSLKNKMTGKAFPLLPKTKGRPQIWGSNKGPLTGWNFYAKARVIWTRRKVQLSILSGKHIFPAKLGPSLPAKQKVFQLVRLIFLLSCSSQVPVWSKWG